MPSLTEIVEQVRRGESVDPAALDRYQGSANSAEQFLAHHAAADLGLRRGRRHLLQALEAIGHADQKVLGRYLALCSLLGDDADRCGPVVKFGASAISRGETALGIDALASGLRSDMIGGSGGGWSADRGNLAAAGLHYDQAAAQLGWTPAATGPWNNKLTRVAYVTGVIADDEPSTRTCLALAEHLDGGRFDLFAYATEIHARRDAAQFPLPDGGHVATSERRGTKSFDTLQRAKVPAWCCPTDVDLAAAAAALADRLIEDKIDVVIFDAPAGDAIAAVVSDLDVARAKVNLVRSAGPLHTAGIDGCIYLDARRHDADEPYWQGRGIDSRFVLEGIEPRPAADASAAPKRSAYGIPESAVVLATSLDDGTTLGDGFAAQVIDVLRSHPHAVYLLIGDTSPEATAKLKRTFEAAGVGKRVGYAGRRRDMPGFLRIADVYLAPATSSPAGLLQAMSVGRPVVAAHVPDAPHGTDPAAAYVGPEACVCGGDPHAYVERVSKLIRDGSYRQKLGKILADRAAKHYSFAETARQIEATCDELIRRRGETAGMSIGTSTVAEAA